MFITFSERTNKMRDKLSISVFATIIIILSLCEVTFAQSIDLIWGEVFAEHGSIMMLVNRDTGTIIRANKQASRFYGYSIAELEGMNLEQLHVYSPSEVQREIISATTEGRNYLVFPQRLANGEVRTVMVHYHPTDGDGASVLFAVVN